MRQLEKGIWRLGLAAVLVLALSACSTLHWPGSPPENPLILEPLRTTPSAATQTDAPQPGERPAGMATRVTPGPMAETPARSRAGGAPSPPAALPSGDAQLSVYFDQLPLPSFIQTVFGSMLKLNFQMDPQVAQRTDLVSLRTGKQQTPAELFDLARKVLRTYGVAVVDVGGFYRIVPESTQAGYAPEIRRGRALPDTPPALRPVFQLVELDVVNVITVSPWMKTLFGNRVQFQDDPSRNAILISGQSDDVAAAVEAVQVLDQPLMRGRLSVRINPAFWSADDLSRRLVEILQAQGYFAAAAASGPQPVIVLPVGAINAVLVFATSQEALDMMVKWARELDKPSEGRGAGYFTYPVRFTDAQGLARTLNELISGAPAAAAAPAVPGQPAPPARRPTRVVVNAPTNSLIFQGGADEYTQWMGLLQELDRPARTVLIEATVAEVRLTNEESLGIEWAFSRTSASGRVIEGGTLGGLGLGAGGLNIQFLDLPSIRVVLNALATNNKARILSSPRLVARNGETATIQVGEEVPIVTSQQTNAATGSTGVLQTIQYRNTGVILTVRPVIHAGGRVELDVIQEVSAAQRTTTGVNISPTFLLRKVESKLSLADGATVLLGGLISQNDSRSEAGVPFFKDIPLVGQAFRNNNASRERTELLVLITPYVVGNDFEARAITDAFRSQLGAWASTGQPLVPPSATSGRLVDPAAPPAPAEKPPEPLTPPTPAAAPVSPSPVSGTGAMTGTGRTTGTEEALGSPASPTAPQSSSVMPPAPRSTPSGPTSQPPSGTPVAPSLGSPATDAALIEELNRASKARVQKKK
jgi:general secretion pathway protein D